MIFSRDKKLKIICSLVILLAISLMPFTNVSAPPVQAMEEPQVAPINPDFLEFWENPPEHFYGYIPPPTDLSHLNEIPVEGAKTLAALPISFDWRAQGKVTSVKDQNPCGTCWVHGPLAAVESKVLIEENTTYDFSEQNLICCTDPSWVYLLNPPDYRCNGGGWSWLAADTLTKKGTRLEECQPYDTTTIDTDTCDDTCQSIKMVTDYRLIANEAITSAAITSIKNAIYNHGPLAMSYAADDGEHIYDGSIYYWPDCPQNEVNHLVCIIGWDNDIAWPGGAGSGAWIVKNSWGTGWENNGYFYLCYGSAGMCEVASLDYKDYDPNEKVYYWDEAGQVGAFGLGDYSGWMASMFTSSQAGNLTHVDFWTTSNNAQYDLYVYRDGDISNGLQNLATSQSGTCQESGYYSIPLTSPVSLTNGQPFTIAVKMTTPGYSYPIPVEYQYASGGTTIVDPPIQNDKSFYRHGDAESWTDIATQECNACLRARVTSGAAGEPDITVSPPSFEVTLPPDITQDYTLNIGNVGGAALSYNISDRQTTGPTAPAGVEPPTLPVRQPRHRHGLIQLNPSQPMSFPTPPTQGVEIYYDDGMADNCYCYIYAGNAFAVRFTPAEYPVDLKTARFFLYPEWPDLDHEQFGVWVFDDDGAGGAPGTFLGGRTTIAADWGWCDVDISSSDITITSGDFYIAYEQLSNYPDCEALGVDWTNPDPRSWDYWLGEWYEFEYDYMIRCVVELGEANNPPNTPSNPCPANHATSVSVDADLSWIGGDPDAGHTVTYDVYFGTGASPALVSNDQSATSYDPGTLSYNTKYYWKIVATDNHAASTSGPVWDFTTGGAAEDCPWLSENPTSGTIAAGNPADSITITINTADLTPGNDYSAEIVISNNDPDENPTIVPVTLHVSSGNSAPNIPSDPLPPNHAPNVSIPANLSWIGGDPDAGDTVTYDVYFGTGATPPLVSNDQSATTYDPGTLNNNTKYYWKIVATDNHGAPRTGPLWDFTTISPIEPTIGFSPTSFSFSATEGEVNPANQTLYIWNSGAGTLDWTVSDDADWLSLLPGSGSSTGEHDAVTVSVDISGMSTGNYDAAITISAPGATNTPQPVPVSLTISPSGPTVTWNLPYGLDADPAAVNIWSYPADAVQVTLASVEWSMPSGLLIWHYGGPTDGWRFYKKGWGASNTLATLVPGDGYIGIVPTASAWEIPQG